MVHLNAALAATVVGTITDGDTTHAPSGDAVFDALALKQPLDSDLTTIAGLTATTDNFIQAKSSAWASRTPAQVKTDLSLPSDTVSALALKAPLASPTFTGTTTADDLSVGDDLTVTDAFTLQTYPVTGAWTAYTPSWTGSGSNPTAGSHTISGKYIRIGQTVHFIIEITAGASNYGTGNYSLTLPFNMAATTRIPFGGTFWDNSLSDLYPIWGRRVSGATVALVLDGTTAGGPIRSLSQTAPVTIATSDQISIHGTYEAA
jgi:hypothetical protein